MEDKDHIYNSSMVTVSFSKFDYDEGFKLWEITLHVYKEYRHTGLKEFFTVNLQRLSNNSQENLLLVNF